MLQITWDLTVKITSSNSATGHDLPVNRCLTLDHGLRPSLGRHSLPSMLKCLRSLFSAGFQKGCSTPQKDITKWKPENYPKNNIKLYHAGSTCHIVSQACYTSWFHQDQRCHKIKISCLPPSYFCRILKPCMEPCETS